jgi:hypothetical protein
MDIDDELAGLIAGKAARSTGIEHAIAGSNSRAAD